MRPAWVESSLGVDGVEILYLLVPMSVLLVLLIVGVFAWALNNGQMDDLEREGGRILEDGGDASMPAAPRVDGNQLVVVPDQEQSRPSV
jgi:cbb3-type cytochrome oxidase maturation protein